MIQNNCRIENCNGIKFYEQDILFDNYQFVGDVNIDLTAKYYNPGLGIALITSEGTSIEDKNEVYLFRIGENETSVIYRKNNVTRVLLKNSLSIDIPIENLKLSLKKSDKRVSLYLNDNEIFKVLIPSRMDIYNLGIYSNAGNVITDLSVASNVPDGWLINMANTNGGYINFFDDSFNISNCENDAQIEQDAISLKAGTYYFNFKKDTDNDIRSYVFLSNDTRIDDEDKNILKNDNSFVLSNDSKISIKFVGSKGTISDIHISDNSLDKYVSSASDAIIMNGSYIKIATNSTGSSSMVSAEWKATITDTPYEFSKDPNDIFYVIADNMNKYTLADLGLLKDIEYDYIYTASDYTIRIYKDTELINTLVLNKSITYFTILNNVDAVITDFSITDNDGTVINLILNKTIKKYVDNTVTGPIIAVKSNHKIDEPLNLSSSYRIFNNGNYDEYIFTNTEREYFTASNVIQVASKISSQLDAITIYGIRQASTCNFNNLYRISEKGLDTIENFSEDYEIIDTSKIISVDKSLGKIKLDFSIVNKFELFVVDYLKEDSYCINELLNDGLYEVDISSSSDNIKLIYEDSVSKDSNKNLDIIYDNKLTDIIPQDNCYIVLRKDV